MSAQNLLEIKGIKNGLLVYMKPAADWQQLVTELVTTIDRQSDFFKGARIALDVGGRSLRRYELDSLQNVLNAREVTLWAVLSESMTTLSTARKLDLQTSLESQEAPVANASTAAERSPIAATLLAEEADDGAPPPIDPEEIGTSGVLVKRTLRSGRTVRSDGHVVVIGDVNPGAEIVAGGDVIIWGRLRGVVHAGALGDETATVSALDMIPMQLRIAGHIATSPKEKRRESKPEIAKVRDNRIVVETWH